MTSHNYSESMSLEKSNSERESYSSMDGDEQAFLVRKMKKFFRANNFDRKHMNKIL